MKSVRFTNRRLGLGAGIAAVLLLSLSACSSDSLKSASRIAGPMKSSHAKSHAFQIETVAKIAGAGGFPSLGINGANQPVIAYYDGHALRQATKVGTEWIGSDVDASGNVGAFASQAFDPAGRAAIAYYDVGKADLKFAQSDGSNWLIETVDSQGDVGRYAALAVNAMGPKIAYQDITSGMLKYAWKSGGAWEIQTVAPVGTGDTYLAMTLDRFGRPRISFYDPASNALRYAWRNGPAWVIEKIEATGTPGSFISMVNDIAGRPRVIYHDEASGSVKHAVRNGIAWTVETVSGPFVGNARTAAAADAAGRLCFGFADTRKGLMCVDRVGDTWVFDPVDPKPVGLDQSAISLALDVFGLEHHAWVDKSTNRINYAAATSIEPVPTAETVPPPVVPGGGPRGEIDD